MPPDADGFSADAESVFSQRSGIRDPLTKRNGETSPDDPREALETTDGDPASDSRTRDERASRPRPDVDRSSDDDDEEAEGPSPQELRERQAQNLRARRRKKKRQVFWNRIRLVLKLGFALLWIAMLWELLQSPLWQLDTPRFTLENRHLLTPTQILPLIRPWVGKPLYEVDTGAVARRIQEQFPIVAHVAVRRRLFPARLNILLTEKTPWAELHALPPTEADQEPAGSAQKPFAASSTGRELFSNRSSVNRPYALVAENSFIPLRGMIYHTRLYPGHIVEPVILSPRTRYPARYIDTLRQFTWKARQLSGLHLLWTDARRPDRVSLRFRETTVILGRLDHTAEERLVRLIPLIPKINELHGAIEAVDLRWEKQVTLHTRPNAPILPPSSSERTDG
jgi:cell division septal protein FtsQ